MSYRVEKNGENTDIVIDGWEKGIADSPYFGIADIRNANIDSTFGDVCVGFDTTVLTKPPTVTTLAFTVSAANDTITVASTTGWYNGMAIVLNTLTGGVGLSTGRVYWVGNLSGNTFKPYCNPSRTGTAGFGGVPDVLTDGSGTLSSYTLGKSIDKAIEYLGGNDSWNYEFILDSNGRVWWIDNKGGTETTNLVYLGNDTLTSTGIGRGLRTWKGYILVFRSGHMDAVRAANIEQDVDFDGVTGWTYGFETTSSSTLEPRPIVVGKDDIVYYDNSRRVGSLAEVSGETFDPTDSTTWVDSATALDIPDDDAILSLAEFGTDLLVGGIQNRIYPWDRISASFDYPVIVPENRINKIIATNNLAYIFAGTKGNIYQTNRSAIDLYKKIPDHITGKVGSYFTINDICIDRDNLLFSMTITENNGTAISAMSGVWAIDFTTESFRMLNECSNGVSTDIFVIMPNVLSTTPDGNGLILGWSDGSTTHGIDVGSSNPYVAGETKITTDIIPVGTYTSKINPSQFEFKLSKPLVSGETIEIKYRKNLNESFTSLFTTSTVGIISNVSDTTFEDAEWIQLQIILTSTATTPSFIRLREIRIRI